MGSRLYLRATLPPRSGSRKTIAHQQRLALGFHANAHGLQLAEKEARKVGALLDCGEFSWEPYLNQERARDTVAAWVSRFAAEYQPKVAPVTWKTDYQRVLDSLPTDRPLTADLLRSIVETKEENSRQRRRYALTLEKLGRFAGLEIDLKALRGKYSAANVEPRDLPTDEQIIEIWHSIENPGWRWVFGMLATFGLRNHEAFYLDCEGLQSGGYQIRVIEGKTGSREVWANYPEWVDDFDLRTPILPEINAKSHDQYGHRVTQFFKRNSPFSAYNLRHRWAVRMLESAIPTALAAKQMGHSEAVHNQTYQRWITSETHRKAFEAFMMREDRPQPPKQNTHGKPAGERASKD